MPADLFRRDDFYYNDYLQARMYLKKHGLLATQADKSNLWAIAVREHRDGFNCALELLSHRYLLTQTNHVSMIQTP
jgi:hypothetical protein